MTEREGKRERRTPTHVQMCEFVSFSISLGRREILHSCQDKVFFSLFLSLSLCIYPSSLCQLTCKSDTHIHTHTSTARTYLRLRTSRGECRACARIPRRCGECARCVVYVYFLTCINTNLISMHRSSSPCKRQFLSSPLVLLSSLLVCVLSSQRMMARARATASSSCRGHIF